ncbi:hypothetical protein HRS9122_05573 [Pyrenophora teres f. teres]|nr:hypothetical protein HRS9122_05573 [Pyrenophora teres f. teres]
MVMYRRNDPRWNRTLQHITENLEHANESAQENIYGFTQRYINPCFSSISQCVNACTAPCFPGHSDRRRHHGRSRGRAEVSFDFYDDWEQDESDGLLGWGTDNLDRFLGGAANYGATAQPGRQRAMSYGQRNRDTRYNGPRRKSTALARDAAQDPTLIPSSSYFGFLGRLPFRIGAKALRYKPSAADLTEHPGAARPSLDEEQALIEDSDEEAFDLVNAREHKAKGHRRQRSDTHTSGHTTDSLSSRGDIFPSEDELEDAVPLDDEFTIALERRTTSQWNEDAASSNKARSSTSNTKTLSSRNTTSSDKPAQAASAATISELDTPTLADLDKEEDRLRIDEEDAVHRKRHDAHQLAVKRGLAPDPFTTSTSHPSPSPSPTPTQAPVALPTPASPLEHEPIPFPSFIDAQTMPDSSAFYVDESDYSSNVVTPNRPLSLLAETSEEGVRGEAFVPARLPNFGHG